MEVGWAGRGIFCWPHYSTFTLLYYLLTVIYSLAHIYYLRIFIGNCIVIIWCHWLEVKHFKLMSNCLAVSDFSCVSYSLHLPGLAYRLVNLFGIGGYYQPQYSQQNDVYEAVILNLTTEAKCLKRRRRPELGFEWLLSSLQTRKLDRALSAWGCIHSCIHTLVWFIHTKSTLYARIAYAQLLHTPMHARTQMPGALNGARFGRRRGAHVAHAIFLLFPYRQSCPNDVISRGICYFTCAATGSARMLKPGWVGPGDRLWKEIYRCINTHRRVAEVHRVCCDSLVFCRQFSGEQ